jgi:hypothetical protein
MKTSIFKNGMSGFAVLIAILTLPACSKKSSTSAICGAAAMFGDQSECEAMAGGNGCVMSTSQSESGQAVCWRINQNQTSTGTPPGTIASNCQPPYDEFVAPTQCSSTQNIQTITRVCKAGCTCSAGTIGSFQQGCNPDLHGGLHYSADCTSGGGTIDFADAKKACAFDGNACPSGWTALKSGGYPFTISVQAQALNYTTCYTPSQPTVTQYHITFQALSPTAECKSICSERQDCEWWRISKTGSCKTTINLCSPITKVLCY